MNVNSWSPDGRRLAWVSFEPVRAAANVPVEIEFSARRDHPDPFNERPGRPPGPS